jgi:thioredoxin 1
MDVTEVNFEEIVLKSDVPVMVDLWAEWCGPCRLVGPIIDEIGEELDGKVKAVKLDVDSNPSIAVQYGIRNIPTVLFFKNGEVVDKQVGAVPKNIFMNKLKPLLD